MLSCDSLALGGGDLVVNWGTGDLGDGVAVLDLDGDELDLGVVNTVLGGDLTAGVLHGGSGGVSDSVSSDEWSGNGSSSGERSGSVVSSCEEILRIGLSVSLGVSLGDVGDWGNSGGITDVVGEELADLLVLNLLGLHGLGGAHVLGVGDTGLGGEDLDDSLAVGGGDDSGSHGGASVGHWGGGQVLWVSLSVGCGSSSGHSQESRNGNNLEIKYFQFSGIICFCLKFTCLFN